MPDPSEKLERDLHIAARPEIVFSYFTDPVKMARWFGSEAWLEPQPGGLFRLKVNDDFIARGKYVEVTPYTRLVFTWGWEGEYAVVPPGATTVEILLTPDETGTHLHLEHSGLPVSERAGSAAGWDHHLQRMLIVAEGGDAGRDPWIDRRREKGTPA